MMKISSQNVKRAIVLLICCSTFYVTDLAQTNDFGIWTYAGFSKKLKKFDLLSNAEFRTRKNASAVDRWSVKFEGSFNFNKYLETGAAYQLIDFYDYKYSDYQVRNRFYVFFQGKFKLGHFGLSLRQRIQYTTKDETDRIRSSGMIDMYHVNPDITWRSRLKIIYYTPDFFINPSFSVESFYQFNEPEGNQFEKMRYSMALNYKKKHNAIELFGLIDNEINISDPVRKYVLGISYLFYL